MASIQDHAYLKICANIASLLSVSLASARRKVELIAAKEGVTSSQGRKEIAERLLLEARASSEKEGDTAAENLDNLLEALAEDENFMVED